jgi:hypothetical protein
MTLTFKTEQATLQHIMRKYKDSLLREESEIKRSGTDGPRFRCSAKHGALNCLEKLVNHDDIDLDIKNTVEGDTPLHKAVVYDEDPEIALAIVELLLEAEADPRYWIYYEHCLSAQRFLNTNPMFIEYKIGTSLLQFSWLILKTKR